MTGAVALLAQYHGRNEVAGPPMVELLYTYAVPLWAAVCGYAMALAVADPERRAWLARPAVMLGVVLVLGVGLVGNFAHEVIGGFVADATDGSRGTFEAVVAIAITSAIMPYCTGWLHRYERRPARQKR